MECKFCEGKLEEFLIKKFKYWTVYLNSHQDCLGRMFVVLNRHGPETTAGLTKEEWEELKIVEDKVTNALKELFKPDLMSYLTLQNKDRNHFHVHIFPRYEGKREIHGQEFIDEMWPKPPIPSPKKEFEKEILMEIIKDIKMKL